MEKEDKYYSLIMNYRKEVFNGFKRYCESRKINLDRSRKYKSLFPFENGKYYPHTYIHLNEFNSILDFIKHDKRFSLKSRKEFIERMMKINWRFCLAFLKMDCYTQYKIVRFFSKDKFEDVMRDFPYGLYHRWEIVYKLSAILGTDEDIKLFIKYNFSC